MNTLSIYMMVCISSFFNLSRSTPFDSESAFVFTKGDVTPFPSLNNASLTTTKTLESTRHSFLLAYIQ